MSEDEQPDISPAIASQRMEIDPSSVIVTPAHMAGALDQINDDAYRHRLAQSARPFAGKAHAVGSCQMHMTGLINTTLTGQSMGDPARRLAGAALYALASHLAVMEEFREIKRQEELKEMTDASKRSDSDVRKLEANRDGLTGGDSAGANVRRATPPDSPDSQ